MHSSRKTKKLQTCSKKQVHIVSAWRNLQGMLRRQDKLCVLSMPRVHIPQGEHACRRALGRRNQRRCGAASDHAQPSQSSTQAALMLARRTSTPWESQKLCWALFMCIRFLHHVQLSMKPGPQVCIPLGRQLSYLSSHSTHGAQESCFGGV